MVDQALDASWGEWYLGDLPTALRRAGDALGHGESVAEVRVVPPGSADGPPVVTVVVPDSSAVARLADNLNGAGFLVQWVEESSGADWVAEVLGVRLVIRAEGGAL